MPTELEDLVEFLHHGNTEIRQVAVENLVGYSLAQPGLFKRNQLEPIKDLKLLVKDYSPIAKNALTMLVNLSSDPIILQNLVSDEELVKVILTRVTDPKAPNLTETCMLIANLSKHPSFQLVLTLKLPPRTTLDPPTSILAIDQLLSVFLLGEGARYNPKCTYDHLAYSFAELAKFPEARRYFLTPRTDDDGRAPLSKVAVFTEHGDIVRRRGVANTIKNVCFEVDEHHRLLKPDLAENAVLPFLLLPLMGSEEYPDDETDGMIEELQLLPPDKERERDLEILKTHIDSLLLLTTRREGRELMRKVQVYPIVREVHLNTEDDDVRDVCDRFVQVLMRDEAEDNGSGFVQMGAEEDDEELQIVDV